MEAWGTRAGIGKWEGEGVNISGAGEKAGRCASDGRGPQAVKIELALRGGGRANRGAKVVINASLGSDRPSTEPWTVAANRAAAAGVIFVAAAGNDGGSACRNNPAKAEGVITVAANTREDRLASFSSLGTCTDVSNPGQNILSVNARTTSELTPLSGTSMASPHVAGMVALVLAEAPNGASRSRNQVIARLTKGAPNVGGYPMPWASSMC